MRQVRSSRRAAEAPLSSAENEPQQARLVRPPERGGYGLDALVERRFPSQRHGRADRASRGLLHRIIAAGRASSSPPPNTVSSIRASATSGRGTRAARRRSTSRRNALSSFCRTTTRSPIPAPEQRCHALTSPGRLRAMTAYFLLMPGIPMLFQGQEFGASTPVLLFRRSRARAGARCPRGAPPLPRAISQSRDAARCGPSSPIPATSTRFADR